MDLSAIGLNMIRYCNIRIKNFLEYLTVVSVLLRNPSGFGVAFLLLPPNCAEGSDLKRFSGPKELQPDVRLD